MEERMVQIGVTALRAPSGEFLPSVPLFIKESDAGEINPHTGRTMAEDLALTDVAKVFADKFKQYAEGTKKRSGSGKNVKEGISMKDNLTTNNQRKECKGGISMKDNLTTNNHVYHFDPSSIPQCQVNTLMSAALEGVRELFDRPGEEERFQAWLKKNGLTETPYSQSARK